jgi:hypothetical protein
MKHAFRVPLAALALTASLSAPLLAEETVTQCQDRIISECARAMEDSNWAERVALGIVCTGRLAGCSTINVVINAF